MYTNYIALQYHHNANCIVQRPVVSSQRNKKDSSTPVTRFRLTTTSVVTGLTTLTSGIHVLITAYINHSNQLLSGQGVEGFDTAEINKVFSTGGIPPLGSAGAAAALGPLRKEKKKRVKKERDPDAPKRPLTAFFLFSTNARDLVKRENPGSSPVEVNSEILRRWTQMDEPEKQVSCRRSNLQPAQHALSFSCQEVFASST